MTAITEQPENTGITDNAVMRAIGVGKTYVPFTYLGFGKQRALAKSTCALTDINLTIEEGETVGLLGPNGAGKTTLLKIMTNLIHPSEGRVELLGRDISTNPSWARSMMGLITCDERSFYWRLSGRQNLEFFAALYGLEAEVFRSRMEELLETLDLSYAADRPYHTYSSGMKQKLAIARGHISEPRILFYDEPTRSLDPVSARRIREWMENKRESSPHQAHVIATNHLYEAEQLCDRVFIINHGHLVAGGTIAEIKQSWGVGDSEKHRIVVRDMNTDLLPEIDPEAGLLDIEVEGDADEIVIEIDVARNSSALSDVLRSITQSGAVVIRCVSEGDQFDKAFHSLIDSRSRESLMSAEIQS